MAMIATVKAQVIVDETTFPDDEFREFVMANYCDNIEIDDNYYWVLQEGIKYLSIYGQMKNLKGIEYFTELESLSCSNCDQLTTLDVSKLTTLKELDCSNNNQLTSLDASKHTALTLLTCFANKKLNSLNVSGCIALENLFCYGDNFYGYGQLTSLNASGCIELKWLNCNKNQLTSLNVSGCTALKQLDCQDNQLTSLDVSGLTGLVNLSCQNNLLTSLDVSESWVRNLYCRKNQLTSLKTNGLLNELDCANNQLTSLKIFSSLHYLSCYSNQIKGEAMDSLMASLPTSESGGFYIIDTKDENEGNVCTKTQVAVAKRKGWTVYDRYGGGTYNQETHRYVYPEYEGSDDQILLDEEIFSDANFREALAEILNIAEGDDITGEIIEELTTLDISSKSINDLSGIEYFTALTTLYCHVNQIKNEKMTALIAALPDLSDNEAKGMMRTEETNPRKGALYALDFTAEEEQNVCTAEHVAAANAKGWTVYCKTTNGWQEYTGEVPTGIGASLNDNGKMINDNYYSIDGVKLSGEPTKKGVYIHKGKKVVK